MTAIVVAASVFAWNAQSAVPSAVSSVAGSGELPGKVAAGSGDAGGVVVNEFVPGTYVELHNSSASTVDIGGFRLWLCGSDGVATEGRVALGRLLFPGDFYVVASSSFTGGAPVDQTYQGVLPDGGAVLLDPDYVWVDGAAVVADSPCGEGAPAPVCPQASTARDAASTNTGSNAVDFACRPRSPGEPNPPVLS
jgi:hypothetical protein